MVMKTEELIEALDQDKNITADVLQSLFEYKDGELYRKTSPHMSVKIGDKAGTFCNNGYYYTSIHSKQYLNHRIIFLMVNKYLPQYIDHINGISTDNRIENLRPATATQNSHNLKMSKYNTSGYKGVSWHKQTQKWNVRVRVNKVYKSFGLYDDIELAGLVAHEVRNKYHKEFANHGY